MTGGEMNKLTIATMQVEALRNQLADAQATVEALQRERDHAKKMAAVQKEVSDNQTWHVRELTAALDAERELSAAWAEKAREYELELDGDPQNFHGQGRTTGLREQLSQLQALVRALVGTKSFTINGPDIRTMGGSVLYACSSPMSAERLGALLEYRERTLDATTPALTIKEARHIALDVLYKAEQERIEASKGGNGE